MIAEYVNGAAVDSPTKEYIYSGSALLATLDSGGTPTYHHTDHLSVRLNTKATGTPQDIVAGEQGHYPFGESWYSTSTTSKWQFTSYERDSESSLDYAMFRYDNSRLGRFMTPDPLAGSFANPQSLNRYAYVLNDPTNLVDPLGLRPRFCFFRTTFLGTTPGGDPDEFGSLGSGDLIVAKVLVCVPGESLQDLIDKYLERLKKLGAEIGEATKSTIQCAAGLANELSVASLLDLEDVPIVNAVLSNTFSSASDLAFGPTRAQGTIGVTGAVIPTAVGTAVPRVSNVVVSPGIQTLFHSGNAITLGSSPASKFLLGAVGRTASVLSVAGLIQLGFDAEIFLISAGVCIATD